MHRIEYDGLNFLDADIVSGACVLQHALAGESLASDTLEFRLLTNVGFDFLLADGQELMTNDGKILKEGDYTNFRPFAPVKYFYKGELISKFYLQNVIRSGRFLHDFDCISAIGVLDNSIHPGGVYSGEPITNILAELLAGLDYTVDANVSDIDIYGWLPYDTKRNNMQQITIAHSIAVRNNLDGSLRITALDSNTKGSFLADRLAIGGSVDVSSPKKAVQVTEHYFLESEEPIELFNDTFLTEEIILFSEPAHSLEITGGTIISSSANHALVQGEGAVVIIGKRYLHNTKQVTEGTLIGASDDNIVRVTDATLISPLNSKSVAQKLFEAFRNPKTIKGDVLFGNERPGDVVDIINPYTLLQESAMANKMDIALGGFLKASAEFRVGYKPTGAITGFKNRAMFTTDGTFIVPDGVTQMRIVLASGAQGGQGGFDGEDGGEAISIFDGYEGGPGGAGGLGGKSGSPSRILDILIDVTPGSIIDYIIGKGGIGGLNGELGALGTDTIFGIYTSQNGDVPENGYVDIMTGTAYAFYSDDGVAAADGGAGGYRSTGNKGEDLPPAIGGPGGAGGLGDDVYTAGGGGGSGAALNTDGLKGGDNWIEPVSGRRDRLHTGDGAPGVSPPAPPNVTLANGGHGGHGGSGGGGAGGARERDGTPTYNLTLGTPGPGGTGSQGSSGGDGFIIIYY